MIGVRRSCIYVPGDSEKMLKKAAAFPADVLLLNLEDGVADSQKERARENIIDALGSLDFGAREVVVRINSYDTETGRRDLSAVVPLEPAGICLPKVENVAELQRLDEAITELEKGRAIPEGSVKIHGMIESAAGVLNAPAIAAASPRMVALIFGSADYVKDLRCIPDQDRSELSLALQLIVTSARAAGIDAIDAPCFDLGNQEQLRSEATQARRLGYEGKSVLHPAQLDTVNSTFDVTAEEIAWAREVLSELVQAEEQGRALTVMEGHLIDNPHRRAAERILRRAERPGRDAT
jgi:citrate lyase subunit beta/citryl-CoA lyase